MKSLIIIYFVNAPLFIGTDFSMIVLKGYYGAFTLKQVAVCSCSGKIKKKLAVIDCIFQLSCGPGISQPMVAHLQEYQLHR